MADVCVEHHSDPTRDDARPWWWIWVPLGFLLLLLALILWACSGGHADPGPVIPTTTTIVQHITTTTHAVVRHATTTTTHNTLPYTP